MRIGLSQRLYLLVALFAVGCAALAATLIWLQEQRAWDARGRQLEALVESAIGVMEAHKALADKGVMPEEEAKQRAISILTNMHYGNYDYFIVWGMSPEVPAFASGSRNQQPPGKPQIDNPDRAGKPFVRELYAELQKSGQMLQHILWSRPNSDVLVTKTNFAKVYQPWKLIIMTGLFGDDIAVERNGAMYQAAGATFALVLVLGLIA